MRPSLHDRQSPSDADWVTRDQIVHLFGISYDLAGRIPAGEVPRVAAGKSHIFHRPSLNAFLLKVAASVATIWDKDILIYAASLINERLERGAPVDRKIVVPAYDILSMDTEWRPAGGVVTATVAECESVAVNVPRGDKPGGAMIYLTRVNGIVFVSQFGASGCQVPANAQSFPGLGRFPLSIQGRVQGATITISGWGSGNGYPMPGGYYQGKPYR